MKHEYRVTKYDPRRRDRRGAFTGDDWTAISDVGRRFGGRRLTMRDYLAVEASHLAVLRAMLEGAEVPRLRLLGVERANGAPRAWRGRLRDGAWLALPDAIAFSRLALREACWAMLEAPRRAFVHFGYDYYLFVGLSRPTPRALDLAARLGLFVEPFRSPYLESARASRRRLARAR